jgi:hypothetical protein
VKNDVGEFISGEKQLKKTATWKMYQLFLYKGTNILGLN